MALAETKNLDDSIIEGEHIASHLVSEDDILKFLYPDETQRKVVSDMIRWRSDLRGFYFPEHLITKVGDYLSREY